jgi:tRNA dimethylallyltransferase
MQAIGYKEVVPYLRGEYSRDDAAYQIKLRTRHFAKRQLTWYKREPDVIYIDRQGFDGNTEDMCRFMSDECRKRGII